MVRLGLGFGVSLQGFVAVTDISQQGVVLQPLYAPLLDFLDGKHSNSDE